MCLSRIFALALAIAFAPWWVGCSPRSLQQAFKGSAMRTTIAATSTLALLRSAAHAAPAARLPALESDELEVKAAESYLGLGLSEVLYGTVPRCVVSSVQGNSSLAKAVSAGMILVGLNDVAVEGATRARIIERIASLGRPITLTFRDPTLFFALLNSTLSSSTAPITTTALPATNSAPKRVLSVRRVRLATGPDSRTAHMGDVVELSFSRRNETAAGSAPVVYTSSVADSSFLMVGDASEEAAALLPTEVQLAVTGMRVGEERRVLSGDPREEVCVKLLSINGEATDERFDISTAK